MRVEKKQIVNDIGAMIEKSAYVYMISYKGLKVREFDELRSELYKLGSRCYVLKNTLVRKAAELKGMSKLAGMRVTHDTAVVIGNGDAGSVAKALSEFAKKNKAVVLKGGYIEGAVLTSADVEAIADLPPREVLLAQLLGLLQAPARNLVSLLHAKLSSVVYVLDSYRRKKESA